MRRSPALPCILLAIAIPAGAAEVYRCTDADGLVEYRDIPCAVRSGGRIAIEPNVTSEIDQSAARAASKAIADRNAARMLRDEQSARQRTPKQEAATGAVGTGADLPWWQLPGPPPDRTGQRAPPDDTSPSPKPPKPVVRPIAPPVQPLPVR